MPGILRLGAERSVIVADWPTLSWSISRSSMFTETQITRDSARAVGPVVPLALALAAGAMIFVASDQLIPESRQQPDAKAPSLGLILGFLCVSTLTKLAAN